MNQKPRIATSKYKGVCFHKLKNLWTAYIRDSSRRILHLGYFKDEEDAAIMYNVAAQFFYGEYAYLNKGI